MFIFLVFATTTTVEHQLLLLTNAFRISKNIPPLDTNPALNRAASFLASYMCDTRSLSHLHPIHHTLSDRLLHFDFVGENIGENIARARSETREVFRVWSKSTEHRKNILGDYNLTGIGSCVAEDGERYFVQVFAKKKVKKDKNTCGEDIKRKTKDWIKECLNHLSDEIYNMLKRDKKDKQDNINDIIKENNKGRYREKEDQDNLNDNRAGGKDNFDIAESDEQENEHGGNENPVKTRRNDKDDLNNNPILSKQDEENGYPVKQPEMDKDEQNEEPIGSNDKSEDDNFVKEIIIKNNIDKNNNNTPDTEDRIYISELMPDMKKLRDNSNDAHKTPNFSSNSPSSMGISKTSPSNSMESANNEPNIRIETIIITHTLGPNTKQSNQHKSTIKIPIDRILTIGPYSAENTMNEANRLLSDQLGSVSDSNMSKLHYPATDINTSPASYSENNIRSSALYSPNQTDVAKQAYPNSLNQSSTDMKKGLPNFLYNDIFSLSNSIKIPSSNISHSIPNSEGYKTITETIYLNDHKIMISEEKQNKDNDHCPNSIQNNSIRDNEKDALEQKIPEKILNKIKGELKNGRDSNQKNSRPGFMNMIEALNTSQHSKSSLSEDLSTSLPKTNVHDIYSKSLSSIPTNRRTESSISSTRSVGESVKKTTDMQTQSLTTSINRSISPSSTHFDKQPQSMISATIQTSKNNISSLTSYILPIATLSPPNLFGDNHQVEMTINQIKRILNNKNLNDQDIKIIISRRNHNDKCKEKIEIGDPFHLG